MNLSYLNQYLTGSDVINPMTGLNSSTQTNNPYNSRLSNFGQFTGTSPLVDGYVPATMETISLKAEPDTASFLDFSGLNKSLGINSNAYTDMGLNTLGGAYDGGLTAGVKDWFAANKDMLNFGANAISGLAGVYGAYNTSKANKAQLALARDQYNTNLSNYRQLTNADMSDRQDRRVAANPNAESRESYMKKWGI